MASSWHVAWACMGLIWRYWRWRQRCASLRCTHAAHSETIPWQHLHTPTKKPRNLRNVKEAQPKKRKPIILQPYLTADLRIILRAPIKLKSNALIGRKEKCIAKVEAFGTGANGGAPCMEICKSILSFKSLTSTLPNFSNFFVASC